MVVLHEALDVQTNLSATLADLFRSENPQHKELVPLLIHLTLGLKPGEDCSSLKTAFYLAVRVSVVEHDPYQILMEDET